MALTKSPQTFRTHVSIIRETISALQKVGNYCCHGFNTKYIIATFDNTTIAKVSVFSQYGIPIRADIVPCRSKVYAEQQLKMHRVTKITSEFMYTLFQNSDDTTRYNSLVPLENLVDHNRDSLGEFARAIHRCFRNITHVLRFDHNHNAVE